MHAQPGAAPRLFPALPPIQAGSKRASSFGRPAVLLTGVKEAGHGEEDLDALPHNQLNLALLPRQRRAFLRANKGQLASQEDGARGWMRSWPYCAMHDPLGLSSRQGSIQPRHAAKHGRRQCARRSGMGRPAQRARSGLLGLLRSPAPHPAWPAAPARAPPPATQHAAPHRPPCAAGGVYVHVEGRAPPGEAHKGGSWLAGRRAGRRAEGQAGGRRGKRAGARGLHLSQQRRSLHACMPAVRQPA